ncbi:peptidase inhibitor family I36 protein, partial [Streptomyces griseoluteus]|uniref:peptidase inhibitor family I36 protein n=1 Tax=Streptomyces griseoluteus TaxID=29306 RepID=UPI0036F6F659
MARFSTRLSIIAASTATLATLCLASPGPTSAAPRSEACPQGKVCFYSQAQFAGTAQIIDFSAAAGCISTIPARSVINNSGYPVGLYVDEECTQYLDRIEPGGERGSLIASVVTAD